MIEQSSARVGVANWNSAVETNANLLSLVAFPVLGAVQNNSTIGSSPDHTDIPALSPRVRVWLARLTTLTPRGNRPSLPLPPFLAAAVD